MVLCQNRNVNPMSEEYWEAQIEAFEEIFKKPVWRDFLETQRKLMDEVFAQAEILGDEL